ncbi:MAG: DUF58 domain-containing protein [Planctomycetes bacterium]|nr:DUF58 domain-containing protein [Planctomycetota bacterium]
MTSTPLKFKANCSSFFAVAALGAIALMAGIYHWRAGAAALGCVFLLGPIAVYSLLRLSLRGLRIHVEQQPSAFEGDPVDVQVRIENCSRLPVFYPEVLDIFGPEIHSQKRVLFEDRILPGECVERSYRAFCMLPRGIYSLGPTAVAVSDPFGWFQIRRSIPAERRLKVYPRIQRFGADRPLGVAVTHLLSDVTHRGVGESAEFAMVREYRSGDPLRRIHWGLTAHLGNPVVREFARSTMGDLNIFLDACRSSLVGIGRSSSFEHSVKIAAGLAGSAIARGHRIQLAVSGDPSLRLRPQSGAAQLQRILDVLVQVKPTGETPLRELLEQRAAEVRPGSTVVVMLSPLLAADADLEAILLRWRRLCVQVLAVVFDAATFRPLWEPAPETRESERFAARLRSLGLRTCLVPCAADLGAVFSGDGR